MNEVIFSAHSPSVKSINYPEYKVQFTIANSDVNVREYLTVFNNFLKALGFSDRTILKGELQMATDRECNDSKMVDEILETEGLVDFFDHTQEILDLEQKHKEELDRYEAEIIKLKAELSRLKDPDNPHYTDEELVAMHTKSADKLWD
jgi:predicted protein tyrosine phosphatase